MRFRLPMAVAGLLLAVAAVPASATPTAPCTLGDAREQFESFPLTFEGIPPCQYRLFFDRQTFTFGADEFFLGGAVRRESYDPSLGGSRDAAISRLESGVFRVWIAEVTESGMGELVEQPLMRTAVKSARDEQFGTHVWLQWGYITQLPAGEYVTVTQLPNGRTTSNRLIITPA
jgi:hypothetical protein